MVNSRFSIALMRSSKSWKNLDVDGPGGTVPPGPHVAHWFFYSLNRSILISIPLLSFEFIDQHFLIE